MVVGVTCVLLVPKTPLVLLFRCTVMARRSSGTTLHPSPKQTLREERVCDALTCCDIFFCTVVGLVLNRKQHTRTTLEEMSHSPLLLLAGSAPVSVGDSSILSSRSETIPHPEKSKLSLVVRNLTVCFLEPSVRFFSILVEDWRLS